MEEQVYNLQKQVEFLTAQIAVLKRQVNSSPKNLTFISGVSDGLISGSVMVFNDDLTVSSNILVAPLGGLECAYSIKRLSGRFDITSDGPDGITFFYIIFK